jgi:hypothetical protein
MRYHSALLAQFSTPHAMLYGRAATRSLSRMVEQFSTKHGKMDSTLATVSTLCHPERNIVSPRTRWYIRHGHNPSFFQHISIDPRRRGSLCDPHSCAFDPLSNRLTTVHGFCLFLF